MFASLDMIHDFNYFFSFKIKGDKQDDYIQDDRDRLLSTFQWNHRECGTQCPH